MGHLDHQEFEHRVSMGKPSDVDQAQEMLCFSDILGHKGAHCLGVKDKYKLALTVASAVLQLHATPWLEKNWRLDDIDFVCCQGVSPSVAQAYVTKSFFVSPKWTAEFTGLNKQRGLQACAWVANEEIFALGVALIEISFGVPILSLKESIDPDIPGFTEFCIASRLVNQNAIRDRDHDKYAEVVLRCAKGQLSTLANPLSLEDARVQQSLYEDVVLPLQELNGALHNDNDFYAF
ncbi:hypothetical protein MMC20_000454 [Loxospora ochrophaea]|nr:hypothetical protein [Loxospora ochrophaea]